MGDVVISDIFIAAPPPPTPLNMCIADTSAFNLLTDGTGHYGPYQITIGGIPAARRVRLYDEDIGQLARQVWSDTGGMYQFNGIDESQGRNWLVVCDDYLKIDEAGCKSWQKSE